MEISIGEYVRLKNGKIIRFEKFGIYRTHTRKINGKYETGTFENKCIISGRCHYKYDNIVKHSKNIIDLIEQGDYVNGYKVLYVCNKEPCPSGKYVDIDCDKPSEESYFFEDEIKSIITKEQIKQIEFRIKE